MLPLVKFFRAATTSTTDRGGFVHRPHDALFSMPESHDDTLDFSIETASLAAVAANENSAWQFRNAARYNTAVRGSDVAAHEIFPAPRPQNGTLDFSIEPAPLAAASTNRDPGNSSTASSFITDVRGSDTAALTKIPRLAHKTAHWNSVLRPLYPLL